MLYTIPHYYHQFVCKAGQCEATCCAGWQIMIDKKALKKYERVSGPFGNRLHNSIDWREGSFLQYDHRCAFLNEENLCDLYAELGADALCKTCRTYPRHIEEFEGSREISLSLSCPEAARIILGCREPVHFLSKEKKGAEEAYEEFDYLLFTALTEVRDVMLEILQNRETAIELRMSMVLALAHDFQTRIDQGTLYETEELLKRYTAPGAREKFKERLSRLFEWRTAFGEKNTPPQGMAFAHAKEAEQTKISLYHVLRELEVLDPRWPEFLERISGRKAMGEKYSETAQSHECEQEAIWWEQLMVYFLFTYFCGAVYDGQAYGKVKLAVASTLLVEDMAKHLWTEAGEEASDVDNRREKLLVLAAYRYSRELEHSDQNLMAFEKQLLTENTFSLEKLLALIWTGSCPYLRTNEGEKND